ncbi:efflux RND transporter periplasmic adaptor subunit [Desulfomarina profundi]|nr:efflux RND transporter periplasmic adaptor subunit [Desulfomarina profundi]
MSEHSSYSHSSRKTAVVPDIHKLSEQFLSLPAIAGDERGLVAEFLQLSIGLINGAGGMYQSAARKNPIEPVELFSRQALSWSPELGRILNENGQDALENSRIVSRALEENGAVYLLSCPVGSRDRYRGCLSFVILPGKQPIESFLAVIQLLAVILSSFLDKLESITGVDGEKLLQLTIAVAGIIGHRGRKEAYLYFNEQLRSWAGCDMVAVGSLNDSGQVVLKSLSDVTSVDSRTERSRILMKGLSECVIHQHVDTDSGEGNPVFQEMLHVFSQKHACGLALVNGEGVRRGAVVFFWDGKKKDMRFTDTIRASGQILASALLALENRKGMSGGIIRLNRLRRLKTGAMVAVMAILLGLFSLLPVPFRIHANCSVLPVYKRFVVAGFDGILKQALVQPGDRVQQGQVMAKLDGRETALLKGSLEAERQKALKTRDHHLATGDTAATQIAQLEVLRLEKQIDLLREREHHLVLTSPIDGIVLAGDMMRIQGSPVNKGKVLFEVAPLNKMIVELGVAEENIGYISRGMSVKIRFEAFRNQAWQGEVQRIKPEAEIRNNRNVFLVELEFDNLDDRLRPGMKGKANVEGGKKPLAWIVFRKPWYTFLQLIDSLW